MLYGYIIAGVGKRVRSTSFSIPDSGVTYLDLNHASIS